MTPRDFPLTTELGEKIGDLDRTDLYTLARLAGDIAERHWRKDERELAGVRLNDYERRLLTRLLGAA